MQGMHTLHREMGRVATADGRSWPCLDRERVRGTDESLVKSPGRGTAPHKTDYAIHNPLSTCRGNVCENASCEVGGPNVPVRRAHARPLAMHGSVRTAPRCSPSLHHERLEARWPREAVCLAAVRLSYAGLWFGKSQVGLMAAMFFIARADARDSGAVVSAVSV